MATTYYVAKNGSPNNPGTFAQPWLTLADAENKRANGDVIYARTGTYNEKLSIGKSGFILGYPGDAVVIDGTGKSFSQDGLVSVNNVSNVTVGEMKIQNSPYGGLFGNNANYLTLRNLVITECQWSGIHVLKDWNVPHFPNYQTTFNTGLIIDHCDVSFTNYNAYDEAISLRQQANFEIMYTKVSKVQGHQSSLMNFCDKEGIDAKVGSNHGKIHHCDTSGAKIGIYVGGDAYNGSNETHVYCNNIHDNADPILNKDGGAGLGFSSENGFTCIGFYLYNNLIWNNGYAGFKIGQSTGVTMGFTFIFNTLYNNGKNPGGWWEIFALPGITYTNCLIQSNIIVDLMGNQLIAVPSTIVANNNLFTDPGWVDPAHGDFHLVSISSSAIGKGIANALVTTDYDGRNRSSPPCAGAFEYVLIPAPPTITSFTPTSGPTGTTVVITGTNFIGVTIVAIGGVNVSGFLVNSPTTITATVGAGTTGAISVTTPGGTAISSQSFGSSNATFGLNSGNTTGFPSGPQLLGMRFQNVAGSGTLTKLELLTAAAGVGIVRLGVYSDNNGAPGNLLLDSGGNMTPKNGWLSISGLSLPVVANAYYWLTFFNSADATIMSQNPSPVMMGVYPSSNYSTGLPTVFPGGRTSYNWQFVMRATVAVSSGMIAGSAHLAALGVLVTPAGKNCVADIAIGTSLTTSSQVAFTSTGANQLINCSVIMPITPGTYQVYGRIYYQGNLINTLNAGTVVVV